MPGPATATAADLSSDFVFSTESAIWRINSQWTGLVYGPAAAILQIAHPAIAAGVARHSDFRNDTLGRLHRTLYDVNQIAFGTRAEAEAVRRRLRGVHGRVRGVSDSGVAYDAFDQDLMVWVLATLVMASIQGWELVHGLLGREEKQALLDDMVRFGTFFGVQADERLRGWNDFETYYEGMISGGLLGSDPVCGRLARVLVNPRDSVKGRVLGLGLGFLPVETLPPGLLERLTLRSTVLTRLRMRVFRAVFPRVYRWLPEKWRFYERARRRRFESQ